MHALAKTAKDNLMVCSLCEEKKNSAMYHSHFDEH